MNPIQSSVRKLGVVPLAMISVSAIVALQSLPSLAKNGFSVVSLLSLAALLFFIPTALACAELGSAWPKSGGVYAWVKEAFGEALGTWAVWLEWIGGSVVWLPTILSYIASCLAYTIHPSLIESQTFLFTTMLAILWLSTFLNFFNTRTSCLSMVSITAGSIIPGLAIILLGLVWVSSGQMLQIDLEATALLPEPSLQSLAYFTAVALGFAGIEVISFYVQDIKDPQRTFPQAIFIAAIFIIVIYILGTLTIAVIIPHQELELAGGMMQAIHQLFSFLQVPQITRLFAFICALGGLALLNTWLIAPSKGLLTCALHNNFPSFMQVTNSRGSPVAILLIQALIGSLLIGLYLFAPSVNQLYWIFQTQAIQLLLMMYILIFLSVLKLRYSQPQTLRLYKIPGGKAGLYLSTSCGIGFCLIALLVGFIPPSEYPLNTKSYLMIILSGLLIFSAPPFLWWWKKKRD